MGDRADEDRIITGGGRQHIVGVKGSSSVSVCKVHVYFCKNQIIICSTCAAHVCGTSSGMHF